MTYKVYFINFSYYSDNCSDTLEGAKKIAVKAGFQSQIEKHDDNHKEVVLVYSATTGFRKW